MTFNHHKMNHFQTYAPKNHLFWQEKRGWLQKKRNFFSRFFVFERIVQLQPLAAQPHAAGGTPLKKSCLKTYGRFFGFSNLCQNGRHDDN
jgi:hypothetical protein